MSGLHHGLRRISFSLQLVNLLHGSVNAIAEALKEKQLFAIAVKDVDDLLFNC